MHKLSFIILSVTILILSSCSQEVYSVYSSDKWFSSKQHYEGLDVYLRKPDIENIQKHKEKYNLLFTLTHTFDKVTSDGFPEPAYNASLEDFDNEIINLFDEDREGFIFLIETFNGERMYMFYISEETKYSDKIDRLKEKYAEHKIRIDTKSDEDYGLIKTYPFKIYE